MQETRNNCFRSKKRSTTLLQTKTGKHECQPVKASTCGLAISWLNSTFLRRNSLRRFSLITESTQQLALNLSVEDFTFFYVLFDDNATAIPSDSKHNFSVGLIAFCDASDGLTGHRPTSFSILLVVSIFYHKSRSGPDFCPCVDIRTD